MTCSPISPPLLEVSCGGLALEVCNATLSLVSATEASTLIGSTVCPIVKSGVRVLPEGVAGVQAFAGPSVGFLSAPVDGTVNSKSKASRVFALGAVEVLFVEDGSKAFQLSLLDGGICWVCDEAAVASEGSELMLRSIRLSMLSLLVSTGLTQTTFW